MPMRLWGIAVLVAMVIAGRVAEAEAEKSPVFEMPLTDLLEEKVVVSSTGRAQKKSEARSSR